MLHIEMCRFPQPQRGSCRACWRRVRALHIVMAAAPSRHHVLPDAGRRPPQRRRIMPVSGNRNRHHAPASIARWQRIRRNVTKASPSESQPSRPLVSFETGVGRAQLPSVLPKMCRTCGADLEDPRPGGEGDGDCDHQPAILRVASGHPQPAVMQGADRSPDRPGAHHHHRCGFLPVPLYHGAAQSRQAMRRTTT